MPNNALAPDSAEGRSQVNRVVRHNANVLSPSRLCNKKD